MIIEEKLDNIIRCYKNIFDNSNFHDLEFLEGLSLSNIKREKHHLCFVREYLNDDRYFEEQMTIFEILTSDDVVEINVNCTDNTAKNTYTVDVFFNYMMLFLVISIYNRDEFLDLKDKQTLTVKFFEHFKIKNGTLAFKLDKYLKLLTDYDLKTYNYLLSKDGTLDNLKNLNEAQDFIDTLTIRLNNINNKIIKSNNPISQFIKKKKKFFKDKYFIENEIKAKIDNEAKNDIEEKLKPLSNIWIPNAKISLQHLLEIGIENKIWDENYNIITKRNSLYGSGKSLLASLSIALKNFAYPDTYDHKILGNAFCKVFNVTINEETKEPYKSFETGNTKYIKEFKRLLQIKY
ncbi:hypothetical protein [Thalassobellus suaedae]|uniref:Uncharacterized protein n=1 Tax=Thalassobellus suaedae TaxID=3074124 RepID=A0ABY9XP10_9FLAO|nr:hypothetical protein RHP51_10625 [Flavobacteriaceae bacterium HL-DH14]